MKTLLRRQEKIILMLSILNFSLCLNTHNLYAADERKVAVLPFANLMKDSSLDWLSTGISSTITTKLGKVP